MLREKWVWHIKKSLLRKALVARSHSSDSVNCLQLCNSNGLNSQLLRRMKLSPYSSLPPYEELREWLAMKNTLIMFIVTTTTVMKQVFLQHILTSPDTFSSFKTCWTFSSNPLRHISRKSPMPGRNLFQVRATEAACNTLVVFIVWMYLCPQIWSHASISQKRCLWTVFRNNQLWEDKISDWKICIFYLALWFILTWIFTLYSGKW